MKLFIHYCLQGFSNCYILGSQTSPEAIIVDPGNVDVKMLSFIEGNEYQIKGILITHNHRSHVQGLKTLKRIYDAEVFAVDPNVCENRATVIKDGEILKLGSFEVEVFFIPGHTADSAAYRIENMVFTGDSISAGLIGGTVSSYGKSILANSLTKKIFSLPGDTIILSGHGPPTTVETERHFNVGMDKAIKIGSQRGLDFLSNVGFF